MPEVICNTSPIQYLHQVNLLDLLPELYGAIVIPEGVAAELDAGLRAGISLPDAKLLPWLSVKYIHERNLLPMISGLGIGEKEVLALAVVTTQSLAVLDDFLARRYASFIGIRFTGTLGILLKAKEKGLLDTVTPVLDLLEDLQFRLDPQTRKAVLKLAREAS
jgi:uncharacterized protein